MKLNYDLLAYGVKVDLSDDECDFLDSIYLPSKYPVGSVLPYFNPDRALCESHIPFAEVFINSVKNFYDEQ